MLPDKISTKLGDVYVRTTDGKHIFAEFGRKDLFVVNTVPCHGSVHMYLWCDGQWHIGQEWSSNWDQRQGFYIRRSARVVGGDLETSEAARNKAIMHIRPALVEWAAKNAKAIAQADAEDRASKIVDKTEKIHKLQQEIVQLQQEIDKLSDIFYE